MHGILDRRDETSRRFYRSDDEDVLEYQRIRDALAVDGMSLFAKPGSRDQSS